MLKVTVHKNDAPSYRAAVLELPEREDALAEKLAQAGVGATLEKNCQVAKLEGDDGALQALVGRCVNADELQYLAKRLDSFVKWEMLTFRAAAAAERYTEVKDLINLTFNLHCYTVISDFSNVGKIGEAHFMARQGGVMPSAGEHVDFNALGRELISEGDATITPYGVLYRNGNEQELLYNGRQFPLYLYNECELMVTLTLEDRTETIYLPCFDIEIEKALLRLSAATPSDCTAKMDNDLICEAIRGVFEKEFTLSEHLDTLNRLARCYVDFDDKALENVHTVFDSAWPQTPEEVLCLAENVHEFTVIPGIGTAEEYGRYMIEHSGRFELDPNLEGYVDFKRYGEERVQQENGTFGDRGYVAYQGTVPLVEEILGRTLPAEQSEVPDQGPHMGGLE